MPSQKQQERGTKTPYSARYLVDVGACTGLDLAHDPSTVPATGLTQAVNVRVHDGIVLSRGGQSETESGMQGCVQGLIGIEGVGTRMVVATNEQGASTPAAIGLVDENLRKTPADDTNFELVDGDPFSEHPFEANRSGNNFEDSLPRVVYAWWDGSIVFQDDGLDKLYKLILPEEGIDKTELGVEELFPLIVPGEVDENYISSFATLPQVGNVSGPLPLYMGNMDGGVVAYVNGQMVRLLADGTFSSRVTLFTYNNQVYAAGTNKIMYQSNGWASGGSPAGTAWTNLTLPAGPADFRPMAGIEGLGFGWLGGFDAAGSPGVGGSNSGYILKVDDSSGTPVITVGLNGVGGGDFLWSVDDFTIGPEGRIYAAYRSGGFASFFGKFGEFSGSSLAVSYQWGESEAMCYRIAGTANKVYGLGWGSDSETTLVATGIGAIINWGFTDPSPFDMVLF